MPKDEPWIGVDFDGTLAYYDKWRGPEHCGQPIPLMLANVERWLSEGREVRIFTARMFPYATCIRTEKDLEKLSVTTVREKDAIAAILAIREWCRKHLGQEIPITNVKDYAMVRVYDDRAVQVEKNTGRIIRRAKE